jgi:hypothetical protein
LTCQKPGHRRPDMITMIDHDATIRQTINPLDRQTVVGSGGGPPDWPNHETRSAQSR